MSMMAYQMMAMVAVIFLSAIMMSGTGVKLPRLTQLGDSSLSKNSINWLVGIAFCLALLICLV
jgi:hypothetical protein